MNSPGTVSFALPPSAIGVALALKYLGLVGYGVHAAITQVPSFVQVGGPTFSFVWASLVALFASLAFAALARTWFTGKHEYEKWATAGLVLFFLAYSVVLVVRGWFLGNWSGISLAWLPVILMFLPVIRYYELVREEVEDEDDE